MRVPVITGIGIVSPFGVGREVFFDGLHEGRSALRLISSFAPNGLKNRVAGEIKNFDTKKYLKEEDFKRVPRVVPLGLAASFEALADGGIDAQNLSLEARRKIGIVIGSGAGGIDFAEAQYAHFFNHEVKKATPYAISSSFVGMLSSELSIYLGLRGPSHVISTGCTSSTDAIGYARNLIRHGILDQVLTGGVEACITPGILAGFERMKVLSTGYNDSPERASRPFNLDRDGFVLGEGAWIFLMEDLESAQKRKAKIYAEVAGYASTCDAFHRVRMEPSGVEAARAMTEAMQDAHLEKENIDYVNLHGTATQMNDVIETMAVKMAFDGNFRDLWTSATKSMIGHPQGACGAAGVAASVYALTRGEIPPTINYETPDPACDLNYTPNKPVRRRVRSALANCLAFGSKNSALVLRAL